jgi:hypothetical protein
MPVFVFAILALLASCKSLEPVSLERNSDLPAWTGRGENGPFVVQLLLTDDFPRTIREWNVPTPPRLHAISVVRTGVPVSTAFLVAGCEPDIRRKCSVTFDLTVVDDTGGTVAVVSNGPLCVEHSVPPPGKMTLCGGSATITHKGGSERLRIVAEVHDQNSGRDVHLEASLAVAS